MRRQRTSTPLQALVLLNDPQYLEAARVLGQRMALAGATLDERVTAGFRLATGRVPTAAERGVLVALFGDERARFAARPAAAAKLLTVGEAKRDPNVPAADAAAWAVVASTLLSLDEAVNKR